MRNLNIKRQNNLYFRVIQIVDDVEWIKAEANSASYKLRLSREHFSLDFTDIYVDYNLL